MPSFLTSLTQIFSPSTSSSLPSHNRDPPPARRAHSSSHLSVPGNNEGNNLGAYYDDAWNIDVPSAGQGGNERSPTQGSTFPPSRNQARSSTGRRPSDADLVDKQSRRSSYGYGYATGTSPAGYGVPGTETVGLNSSQSSSTRGEQGPNGGGVGSERSSRESSPGPGPGQGQREREPSRDSTTSTTHLNQQQQQQRVKPRSSTYLSNTSSGGNTNTDSMPGVQAGRGFAYPPTQGEVGPMSYGWGGSGGGGRNGTLDPRSSAIMSNRPIRNRVSSTQSFLSPNGPLQYYPPLNHTWSRIKNCLLTHLPELHDSLAYPVDPKDLVELESALGVMLPPSVRDSYLCVDGQDSSSDCREGLFFGLTLLPVEDVLREWLFWRQVESDPQTGMNPEVLAVMSSIPPGWIKRKYACKGWLPLIADKCGNYVGVDLDPGTSEEYQEYWGGEESERSGGPGSGSGGGNPSAQNNAGSWGQVIVFGREFDRKCVLWRGEGEGGWGRWLAGFAEELESGDGWEIDGASDRRGSDGEEDDIGYSSYYFDPSSGTNGAGGTYGEGGTGLRLTGEYRGWSVLEAWWDRSVRKWDELGLSVTYVDLQKEEEYRLRKAKGKQREVQRGSVQGLGFGGMRIGGAGEDVEVPIPVMDEPNTVISFVPTLQAPQTPGPETGLLAARSPTIPYPETSTPTSNVSSARQRLEKLQISDPLSDSSPRLITPFSSSTPIPTIAKEPSSPTHHPLQMRRDPSGQSQGSSRRTSREEGLLSPPAFSSPRVNGNKRSTVSAGVLPPPLALDLPTRADVQAAQAVATAEENGLRGGWVMSMEAVASTSALAARRHQQTPSDGGSSTSSATAPLTHARHGSSYKQGAEPINEMVDIDLEGGRKARFGSAEMTQEEAQREDADRAESTGVGNRSSGYRMDGGSGFVGPAGMRTPSPSTSSMARGGSRTSQDSQGSHYRAVNEDTPKGPSGTRIDTGYPDTPGYSDPSSKDPTTPIARLDQPGSVSGATLTRATSLGDDGFSDVNLGGQAQSGNELAPPTTAPPETTNAKSGKRNSMIMDKLAKAGLAV